MQISQKTLTILKNFSSINQSLIFKQGNTLKTISVLKNILAEATLEDEFPKDFAVYDLNQFLNGLSLYKEPELDFENDEYVIIKEGRSRTRYFFSEPSIIVSPPDKKISLPSEDVQFELNSLTLERMIKASSVYQLPDFCVIGEEGQINLVVRDKKDDTSNDFSFVVGETESEFCLNFKIENIKILPGSYDVTISKKFLSKFESKDYAISYWIALEPDSMFN
jgi:hypothetical protein